MSARSVYRADLRRVSERVAPAILDFLRGLPEPREFRISELTAYVLERVSCTHGSPERVFRDLRQRKVILINRRGPNRDAIFTYVPASSPSSEVQAQGPAPVASPPLGDGGTFSAAPPSSKQPMVAVRGRHGGAADSSVDGDPPAASPRSTPERHPDTPEAGQLILFRGCWS